MAPPVDGVGAAAAVVAVPPPVDAVGELTAETMAVEAAAEMVEGTGVVRGATVVLVGPVVVVVLAIVVEGGTVTSVRVMGRAGIAAPAGAEAIPVAAVVDVTVAGIAVVAPTTLLALM
jgi:hypothetical protein